jgi:hypothetical protein
MGADNSREPDSTRFVFLVCSRPMEQEKLFPGLSSPLTDEEIATVLSAAIACGIRGHREADLYLSGICAKHLATELRLAGLVVTRPPAPRLRD